MCDANGHEGIVDGTGLCASAVNDLTTTCGAGSHVNYRPSFRECIMYDLLCFTYCGRVAAAGHVLCSANAGVTSNNANLWHTFAHEVSHGLPLPLPLTLTLTLTLTLVLTLTLTLVLTLTSTLTLTLTLTL